jgi:undecaprenyl-diphosphatase
MSDGQRAQEGMTGMVVAVTLVVMLLAGLAARWAVLRWPQDPLTEPDVQAKASHRGPLARVWAARVDPTTATGLFLTIASALVVLGAIGVAAVLRMVRTDEGFADFDHSFATWGSRNATDWSTRVLEAITWFGGTTGVIVVSVAAAIVAHRRAPTRALVVFLTLVLVGQLALTNTIKAIVGRERPDIERLASYAGPSFPSGHAAAAAACFAAVALVLGRRRPIRVKANLAGVAAAMAAGVACTRVLLGVHWFTDVIAGVLLGWGWFALCSIAFGGRLLRFGAPVESAATASAVPPSATPSPEPAPRPHADRS